MVKKPCMQTSYEGVVKLSFVAIFPFSIPSFRYSIIFHLNVVFSFLHHKLMLRHFLSKYVFSIFTVIYNLFSKLHVVSSTNSIPNHDVILLSARVHWCIQFTFVNENDSK